MSAPERLGHPVGGVLAERGGDVGVTLGLAELGVAEDLLDDADVDALLEQERGGGVAGVMDSCGPDACFLDQGLPVFPVVAGVDRGAGRGWRRRGPSLARPLPR